MIFTLHHRLKLLAPSQFGPVSIQAFYCMHQVQALQLSINLYTKETVQMHVLKPCIRYLT